MVKTEPGRSRKSGAGAYPGPGGMRGGLVALLPVPRRMPPSPPARPSRKTGLLRYRFPQIHMIGADPARHGKSGADAGRNRKDDYVREPFREPEPRQVCPSQDGVATNGRPTCPDGYGLFGNLKLSSIMRNVAQPVIERRERDPLGTAARSEPGWDASVIDAYCGSIIQRAIDGGRYVDCGEGAGTAGYKRRPFNCMAPGSTPPQIPIQGGSLP